MKQEKDSIFGCKKHGLANHKQEQWKLPLHEYIGHLYQKRFKKPAPDVIQSLEAVDREKRKENNKRKYQQ